MEVYLFEKHIELALVFLKPCLTLTTFYRGSRSRKIKLLSL